MPALGSSSSLIPRKQGGGYQLFSLAPINETWQYVPDLATFDRILADGKIKAFTGIMATYIREGTLFNQATPTIYVQKDNKGGYTVWMWHEGYERYARYYFKDKEEFTTHLRNTVWAILGDSRGSRLFYTPRISPPEQKELKASLIFKNPDVKNIQILRSRKLSAYVGIVYMARVYDSPKGKYIVWADDSNVFVNTSSEFYKKYGAPARYDLKYHPKYFIALEDYLTRRTLKIPIPRGEM